MTTPRPNAPRVTPPQAAGPTPLFLCHANCCRSVLAKYLYEDLCHTRALSAGLAAGDRINDKAEKMLRYWNINARSHRPTQLTRALCDEASAIFVMGPSYLHRLVLEYGVDLADKAYLFRDPCTVPTSFSRDAYKVIDPSFDRRLVRDLVKDYWWMRERVDQIHQSLTNGGPPLVPLRLYLGLCCMVPPNSH